MSFVVDISCRVYRGVLRAYAPELRARFGSDMIEVFRAQAVDAWEARGLGGIVDVWACAVVELIQIALPRQIVLIREPAARLLASFVITLLLIQAFLWIVAPRVFCR